MRLSGADTFVEVAHAILCAMPGSRGGVVEAHDAGGRPVIAVASEWVPEDWPARSVRVERWPFATADAVIAPLVGDTAVIGAVRLAWPRPPPPSAIVEVSALCTHASVRLARIGFPAASAPRLGRLTARQREVATLVARGFTNLEVATALAISAEAVKKHVRHLFALLDVANRTELAGLIARAAPSIADDVDPPPGVRVTRLAPPAMLRRT